MKIVKKLLILLVIACMLWVWPVHPFREVESVRSGNEGHEISKPLQVNESAVQYFKAPDNNLIQLEFVVDFDERYPKEGQLYFELLDSKGEAVFAESMDYAQIPDYKYNGPVINVRLKKGRQYAYRITNVNVTENMPCVVYLVKENNYCLKKGSLEISGEAVQGEFLTRITTNKPLDAANTLAIWGCIGMIGFWAYEVLGRIEKSGAGKSAAIESADKAQVEKRKEE